jgi:tetratricopeptide (TPR) repeat protein
MGEAYQRGMILYQQKMYPRAAEEFRRELAGAPNSGLAHAMLALSLSMNKQTKEGIDEARAAIGADPELAIGHYALAFSMVRGANLRRMGGRFGGIPRDIRLSTLSRAREPMLEALRLAPRNSDYFALMAGIELDLDHAKVALEWVDKGLEANPENVRCAELRSTILRRLGKGKDARETANRALEINPEHAGSHLTQGWNMLYAGKFAQALEHFTQAARLDPNDQRLARGLRTAQRANKPVLGTVTRMEMRFAGIFGPKALAVARLVVVMGIAGGVSFGIAMLTNHGGSPSAGNQPVSEVSQFPAALITFGILVGGRIWRRRRQ